MTNDYSKCMIYLFWQMNRSYMIILIKLNHNSDTSETLDQNIDHTEEVIIGTEHGMTFPTQIGASVCHALIDTGATRSCISEKYYQSLPLTKIQFMQNINVRSATGSNLIPLGLINCSFELGKIKFNSDFHSM